MTETPLPLGYAEQPNPPPRPKAHDRIVRLAAAELLLPEIIQWLGDDWNERDRDDYLNDLIEIMPIGDGYEAARRLDNKSGWPADAELVEILNSTASEYDAEHAAVKAWVIANQPKAKFVLGDVVNTTRGAGPITAIKEDEATYAVATPEFIARYGSEQLGRGCGVIIPFEDCQLVEKDTEKDGAP